MHRFRDELAEFRAAKQGSRHDALLQILSWSFGMHALDLRSAMEQIKAEWQRLTAGEGREDEVDVVACWVAGREIDQRAAMAPIGQRDEDDGMCSLVNFAEVHDVGDDIVEGSFLPGRWTQLPAAAKAGKSSF